MTITPVKTVASVERTVHSDDVDMICESPQDGVAIADAFNTRFGGDEDGIKMCDPKFMLGVCIEVNQTLNNNTTYFLQ